MKIPNDRRAFMTLNKIRKNYFVLKEEHRTSERRANRGSS